MRQQEAKTRILADWQALSEAEKSSDSQVTAFAMKILAKYPFRGSGDHCERIKNWLLFAEFQRGWSGQVISEQNRRRRRRATPPR
jgi:hypothetical protein